MRIIACTAILLLVAPALTTGQMIGLNFSSDREAAALDANETAGVVPQTNWNNWVDIPSDVPEPPTTGDQSGIASPNAGVITDSDGGTHAGVTVSWSSVNAWNTDNGVGDGDNKLMNGYIDNNANFPNVSLDVAGLPSAIADAGYDVYVYFGSDGNDRTGTITDGTATYSYSTFSAQGGGFPGAYALTTDTGAGNPQANYAIFSGHTGTDFSIDLDRGSSNSGIHGLQIVPIPEPTSVTLALLGLLGIAGLARRRK